MKNKRLFSIILIFLLIISTSFLGTKVFGLLFQVDAYTKLRVFSEIVNNIKDYYVDEKDPINLIDSAINGMLKELDPHSVILPPERSQDMDERFQGFGGIGIWFNIVDQKITITDVFKNGPCDKLALMRGDQIVAINSESAIGIDNDETAKKLKGIPGTSVDVLVERPGWEEDKEFTIVRESIEPESIFYIFMLTDEIGYIGMNKYSRTTVKELEKALKTHENENMKKLVLDLRNNPGGYLPISVGVADKFLPGSKKIVYTKGRTRDSQKEFFSTDKNTHSFLPMIVLIDERSASASEIVSGALQDWDRALVIGTTSFGKALVQTPFRLRDQSRLLLTTAKYYTPSGRLIQKSYEGKTREQYYIDSVKDLDEVKSDRLTFRTSGGRIVYGGGGITPDIIIEYTPPFDSTSYKLFRDLNPYYSQLGLYGFGFMFANAYAEEHNELRDDKDYFIKYFQVNDEIIEEYKSSLRRRGIEIDEEEFNAHIDDIKFMLKCELTHQLWGRNEFWQVWVQRDARLKQAISYFNRAEQLLVNNYSSYLER